jgi:predicted nuclease of restriction endonuclease-like (RecB) superfamily
MKYRITGNFCGRLRTAEIKIAEYYVQNTFSNSNSDSAVSVKYLISRNYDIQISKTWYYINVYTTIKRLFSCGMMIFTC